MSDDSDFDESAHSKLLKSVNSGKVVKTSVHKTIGKADSDDLFNSIKTAKKSTTKAKKSSTDEKKEVRKSGARTLGAPVHRQERERIQGAVGFIVLKKDLTVWNDVVQGNRLADQISFPLHQERVLTVDSAAEKTDGFKPKTELELEMASLLNSSKNNMKNDTVYTEAELEIIKAMNVKEAKSKLESMQKMRALVSYREAKYRYASKIKSKGYHRLLKRERRRQLVKEFDDLLLRDPEAAKEKLQELENQRVLERGSLRHHARSKFQQEIVKHAGRDPNAKKVLDEHLRLGRELKAKVGMESESEDDKDESNSKKMNVADMIKSAALAASNDPSTADGSVTQMSAADAATRLYELRARKRKEIEKSRVKADGSVNVEPEVVFEENNDWTNSISDSTKKNVDAEIDAAEIPVVERKEKKSKKKRKIVKGIDEIFNEAENQLVEGLKKEAMLIRNEEQPSPAEGCREKKKRKLAVKEKNGEKEEKAEVDVTLDPRHFLQIETNNLSKVSADLVDKMDEFDEDQERMVAEAFRDDDVIGDFENEKEMIEEGERPKDVDLTLQGWGCWVGPGMTERKRRKRFVVKAKAKKRRDKGKSGVIIAENQESSVAKLQPQNLPFPYTRVEDFEAVVNQPIGKDWNPVSVTRELCKQTVVTQGGRSIRPLDKAEAIKKSMHDSEDEDH